jgi:hypothetical protein
MRAGSGEICLFCYLERTSQAAFLPLNWEDRFALFLFLWGSQLSQPISDRWVEIRDDGQ